MKSQILVAVGLILIFAIQILNVMTDENNFKTTVIIVPLIFIFWGGIPWIRQLWQKSLEIKTKNEK